MPNRILRDWTDSEKMDGISFQAECLFIRIMMKADDFGNFHGNPKLINSFCFPLKNIRETDITRWLQELVSAGLIAFYDADSKQFIHILNFNQRLRRMQGKFPSLTENQENIIYSKNQRSNDRHPPPLADNPPPEYEVETEIETEKENSIGEDDAGKPAPKPKNLLEDRRKKFYKDLEERLPEYGKTMVRAFYDYWSEPNKSRTKMKWELERTWDLNLRLKKWRDNDDKWSKQSNIKPLTPPKEAPTLKML